MTINFFTANLAQTNNNKTAALCIINKFSEYNMLNTSYNPYNELFIFCIETSQLIYLSQKNSSIRFTSCPCQEEAYMMFNTFCELNINVKATSIKPELTKSLVKEKLLTNDKWLIHGLLAIYNNQTDSEKNSQATKIQNNVGFNGADAEILSSISEFYLKNNFLSEKQKNIVRKKLVKYAGQLVMIAESKK